ncbi:MAG: N-acetylgalactosamine-6-sulfatase, partial [Planctomycetota bacterium]
NDRFLTSLEILPSLVAAAGSQVRDDIHLDGYDWWNAVRGADSPRHAMFWKRRDHLAARVGHWKWVSKGKTGGLFNLADDIHEANDQSDAHPEILARMKKRFSEWTDEMESAEPRGPFRDF